MSIGRLMPAIVFRANGDRCDLLLHTNDMLQRSPELGREMAVSHEDHADHRTQQLMETPAPIRSGE